MTLKSLVTVAVIVAALSPTPAKAGAVWESGYGLKSCGEYIMAAEDQRKARPVNANPAGLYSDEYMRYADYLQGFFTGENLASNANGQDGEVGFSQNTVGMLAWLENYCRRNPTDNYLTALARLREELVDKHR